MYFCYYLVNLLLQLQVSVHNARKQASTCSTMRNLQIPCHNNTDTQTHIHKHTWTLSPNTQTFRTTKLQKYTISRSTKSVWLCKLHSATWKPKAKKNMLNRINDRIEPNGHLAHWIKTLKLPFNFRPYLILPTWLRIKTDGNYDK